MTSSYVLLQYGEDPFENSFEDLEGHFAFSVSEFEQNPNLIMTLSREPEWAQLHPDIMGPSNSYLYFGPAKSPGYLVYGNGPTQPMLNSLRQKKDGSTSRYFTAQNGKDFKWRISQNRMECVDSSRNVVATWEVAPPEVEYYARMTLKHSALATVTEILTTLTLNRMARALNWTSAV
ncbi:hypothetical protein GLOTRDRAFT_125209 [Gloeophyllum trabeum ATCC 11539]|uniref:Uncharacterized protein n=1 Tax=Gloeophyllum trabeum (strain ATCC 11539 / FP-39264 / Madison 617) TaxID=670483 RepID=S7QI64_GLOTA|nr:uncharacterized protein GLOTRDRAFT_125209 [Gloeophyllum trabeum ATCC 11539]EPQ58887.1 hypothetical protein GLOTRDRAFT_125209 [Gloeophyllum trabeum ATCC 11539]